MLLLSFASSHCYLSQLSVLSAPSPNDPGVDLCTQTVLEPGHTAITILLPRVSYARPLVGLDPAPCHPSSARADSDPSREEPQTSRKLILRKRTTSPYQVKLPMKDRFRVPNKKPQPASLRPTVPAVLQSSASRLNAQASSLSLCHPPPAVKRPGANAGLAQANRMLEEMRQNASHKPTPALATYPSFTLPAVDTWTELNRDLHDALLDFSDVDTTQSRCVWPPAAPVPMLFDPWVL
ncbi:uncharacterized protein BXZ73DRAFT_100286 [Epithele typhae]|uniref:uncharacterized protein n=1 Tax=Epithele typhae TaxID=378194 RepID=UPI002007D2C4|nr:uncharacterized protein BXZ73DRAFT_100286 [Epithele typhae]KAH9936871.1 hypothetical protein BXZ73DRAFT_100286 [Epithele typhae]